MEEDLILVFPTEVYEKQVNEYLQEHFDNNEYDLSGDGGLDRIRDFDEWLEKIKSDVSEKTGSKDRVASTLYLAIRKSDDKLIGMIQIRHKLNERLLRESGHIGDGVRPTERNKGYASQMIKLALEKCRELKINRVLMTCYKDNIASAKTIMKNGGVLENEIFMDNGKILQRYWISLKKRFGNAENHKSIIEKEYRNLEVNNNEFIGDIALLKINKVKEDWYVGTERRCILSKDYKWLGIYPKNQNYCITAIYNRERKIVEWYIDIARKIGKENGIPYEDDLYLDVVIVPDGRIILLDEEELKEAFEKHEMTKQEYEMAYETANKIMKGAVKNIERLTEFSNKYLKILEEEF